MFKMKSVSVFYLLLLYLVALWKPVLPLFNDALAHTFWEAEHKATVHQHNGEEHVHHELQHEEESDNPATPAKFSDPVSLHLVATNNHSFLCKPICLVQYTPVLSKLLDISSKVPSPPPKG